MRSHVRNCRSQSGIRTISYCYIVVTQRHTMHDFCVLCSHTTSNRLLRVSNTHPSPIQYYGISSSSPWLFSPWHVREREYDNDDVVSGAPSSLTRTHSGDAQIVSHLLAHLNVCRTVRYTERLRVGGGMQAFFSRRVGLGKSAGSFTAIGK